MEAQIEEAIKFRKKANFKILTRLSQIIDQYPYLRFHQILIIYKISELGVDKFNEESVETLKKLEHEMVEKGISKITSNSSDGNNLRNWKAYLKMKSNGDLPNLGKHVVLKTVSPQILDRLRESGLTVCICCEFEGVAWLTFSPGLPFDIHGEGYDFEELGLIGTEANLRYFEKVTPNYIDCGTDVDKFINTCLQFK